MSKRPSPYSQTTLVTCSDNGNSKTAQVLSFTPNQRLVVVIESIRMEMVYSSRSNLYIGNQTGLEFVSSGPTPVALKPSYKT